MALHSPEQGWVWVTVPLDEAVELVVVGDVETWWSHWYREPGGRRASALRCVLEERGKCDLCRAGYDRRTRYVLPVELDGVLRLVEFGRVQFPALACVQETGGLVGARLRCVRERPKLTAPIQIRLIGREVVPGERRHTITDYVGTLGLLQLRLLGDEASESVPSRDPLRVVEGGRRRA